MAKRLILLSKIAIFLALAGGEATAQSAMDRAGALKTWREQCADPDTDLRLGYIEEALRLSDAAVVRICIRQALESEDADIRNLGLRAGVAAVGKITFEVTMPDVLVTAYKQAGKDQKKLDEIARWYVTRDWEVLKTGLSFAIAEADVQTGASVWSPLANRSTVSENYQGPATIVGNRMDWVGSANLAVSECALRVRLEAGATLSGTFQCGQLPAFQVSAKLL